MDPTGLVAAAISNARVVKDIVELFCIAKGSCALIPNRQRHLRTTIEEDNSVEKLVSELAMVSESLRYFEQSAESL